MKIRIVSLIVFLIYLYIPVDTINGILIRKIDISISPLYKIIILILLLFFFVKKNIQTPLRWLLFFILLFALHFFIGTLSSLEIFWGLKFLTIIMSFYFFKELMINGQYKVVIKLASISFWLIAFNIIVGLSGFGYAQYARNDIGTRGLFYAGNELGVLLLVTSIIILGNLLIQSNIKKYLLYSFSFLFFAAMLTSKTAVLGQVLIICLLPIINLFSTRRGLIFKKSSLKLVSFGLFVLVIGLPYLVYFVLFKMNLIERIAFYANKFDVLTLIFSRRNVSALEIFEYLGNHLNIFNLIFGYGYNALIEANDNSAEIDFIDLFMVFGLFGMLAMYGFFVSQLYRGVKLSNANYPYKPYVRFGILLLLILSCTSGHVLNSGMAGIMIGALLALQYYKSEVSNEESQIVSNFKYVSIR